MTGTSVEDRYINNTDQKGIAYMVEDAKKSPVRQFNLAPSCIPSDSEFETAPYPVLAPQTVFCILF